LLARDSASWVRWVLVLLTAFVALMAWAMASPIGSPPDGDYHMASIWCAQGDRLGMCKITKEKNSPRLELRTPRTFSRYQNPYGHFCYVGNSGASAGCTNVVDEISVSELIASGRIVTSNPGANPFYRINSYLASRNIEKSSIQIRVASIAFFLGVSVLILAAFKRYRVKTAFALLIGLGPWGSFLIASIHPSAWTITLLPLFLVTLFVVANENSTRLRIVGALLALIIWFVARDVRSDARILMAIALISGIAWGIDFQKFYVNRSAIQKVAGLAVIGALYLIIFHPYVRSFLGPISSAKVGAYLASPSDRIFNLVTSRVPVTIMDLFGSSLGLGSTDTPLSQLVTMCGISALVLSVFSLIRRVGRRELVVVGVMTMFLILLPLRAEIENVGTSARYILPLYLMCLVAFFSAVDTSRDGALVDSRVRGHLLVAFLTLGNSVALHQTMRRYITGVDVIGWDLNRNAEWWWSAGPSPMTVWLIGTCAFFFAALMIIQESQRQEVQ